MPTKKFCFTHNLMDFHSPQWNENMKRNLINACKDAVAVSSTDGNKIYIALDEGESEFAQSLSSSADGFFIDCTDLTSEEIYTTVRTHYLRADETERRIWAVCTRNHEEHPNDGYITLVPADCNDAFSS